MLLHHENRKMEEKHAAERRTCQDVEQREERRFVKEQHMPRSISQEAEIRTPREHIVP
jgi:hypothetical protein